MDEKKIADMFAQGFDCAQVISYAIAKDLNMDTEIALKSSAAFGAGMFEADLCGAYVGGLIALGLKYGHCKAGDEVAKGQMISKIFQYKEEFAKIKEDNKCSDILGYNLTIPSEAKIIEEKNLLMTVCPRLVKDVIEVVEKL
ncbi:MAG: C-GCAxxG-C-C family protein [Peptostreptococcus sp.]|uniref:C-GCAxxG-C-C family protein n=1 Tax=Peptostreptococcus sp. TaxID=1262 RepID=UPI002FCA1A85